METFRIVTIAGAAGCGVVTEIGPRPRCGAQAIDELHQAAALRGHEIARQEAAIERTARSRDAPQCRDGECGKRG